MVKILVFLLNKIREKEPGKEIQQEKTTKRTARRQRAPHETRKITHTHTLVLHTGINTGLAQTT